jgi:hypothetical protein
MRRIQVDVTDEHDRLLAWRARAERSSKAEVIRRILDDALNARDHDTEALTIIRATAGVCADYPDWPEWQRVVRGNRADERLPSGGP